MTIEEFFFKPFKKSEACFKDVFPSVPLITGISSFLASSFALVLSPKVLKDFSLGPINFIFAFLVSLAKSGFSLKKP